MFMMVQMINEMMTCMNDRMIDTVDCNDDSCMYNFENDIESLFIDYVNDDSSFVNIEYRDDFESFRDDVLHLLNRMMSNHHYANDRVSKAYRVVIDDVLRNDMFF